MNRAFEGIGIDRNKVYIANIVKICYDPLSNDIVALKGVILEKNQFRPKADSKINVRVKAVDTDTLKEKNAFISDSAAASKKVIKVKRAAVVDEKTATEEAQAPRVPSGAEPEEIPSAPAVGDAPETRQPDEVSCSDSLEKTAELAPVTEREDKPSRPDDESSGTKRKRPESSENSAGTGKKRPRPDSPGS